MIDRDKRATKAGFVVGGVGLPDCGTGARRRGRDVATKTDRR